MKTKLILIGGFLGSGKTTLLREAALRLSRQGRAVGLITNDQAADLVDTAMLCDSGMDVREVAGSCFCCNFGGLMDAAGSLIERGADTILAEPVGSCTDLSATIMQPLKHRRPDIDLAPLTVLATPDHVREALGHASSALHDSARYILRLQMAESDILLLNKVDLFSEYERAASLRLLSDTFPGKELAQISARVGNGVDAWLTRILRGGEAGQHIVDVDYDRYAEGEAVLGWLNASVQFRSLEGEVDFLEVTLRLMRSLHQEFGQNSAEIGHVKAVVESGGRQRVSNLTALRGQVATLDDTPLFGMEARVILNARVQMPATALDSIARRAIANVSAQGVRASTIAFHCLTPQRPQPTYRYQELASRGQCCCSLPPSGGTSVRAAKSSHCPGCSDCTCETGRCRDCSCCC